MAERPPWDEMYRQAMDANLRYVEGLGRVASDYVRAWSDLYRDMGVPIPFNLGARDSADDGGPPKPPPGEATATLVLEGKGGEEVRAVFAVRNDTESEVSAPVMSTGVRGPAGEVAVGADPVMVTVAAGDRALVTVGARVPPDLPVGESLMGEVSVPGLSDTRVPVMLRRVEGD